MDLQKLRGVGTALVTPFRNDGTIDFTALKDLIEFQIDNNVNFLTILGTTSESATMTNSEKNAVVDFIIETVNGRIPVVVGCGGNNTSQVIDSIKELNKPGVDAILSVVPYYNKPTQNGLFQHFKAIANSTDLPIILYNVPGRTASNLTADTTLKLAREFKNIIAIKEASPDFSQAMQIVKNKPDDFLVLSGDDALTLPLLSCGFDGVISVVSNAFPSEFSTMVWDALNGGFAKARVNHYKLIDIIESMFEQGNPAGIKAFLTLKGFIENNLRLPLVPVSGNLFAKIEQQLVEIQG